MRLGGYGLETLKRHEKMFLSLWMVHTNMEGREFPPPGKNPHRD